MGADIAAPVRMEGKQGLSFDTITVGTQRVRIAIRSAMAAGDRPPLLICNGIGANMELLAPFIDALPDREVILFDAPGTGGSPAPLLPYRLSGLARTVTRVLDAMGRTDPVDVMGISWGGVLAQTLAFRHPKRVRKLVLAATSPGSVMIPGRPDVLVKLISPRRYTDPEYLREHAGRIYGGRFRSRNREASKHSSATVAPSGRGYLYQLLATWGWTSLPWLWLIRQPTLVIHGNDDPIVPIVNARLVAGLIPNSRFEEVDDGHLFMVTSPEETVRTIEHFLDG